MFVHQREVSEPIVRRTTFKSRFHPVLEAAKVSRNAGSSEYAVFKVPSLSKRPQEGAELTGWAISAFVDLSPSPRTFEVGRPLPKTAFVGKVFPNCGTV